MGESGETERLDLASLRQDPFPDWRSGPSVDGIRRDGKDGPPKRVNVTVVNPVKLKGKGRRGSTMTHRDLVAVPLCLDMGIEAAEKAKAAFAAIEFHESPIPTGINLSVMHDSHDDFVTYIQQSLIAVTFSMRAIEAFANAVIGSVLVDGQFFDGVSKRGKPVTHTGAGVQRHYSTEHKLTGVLPKLTGEAPIPLDDELWEGFKALQNLRNEAIHLKWERQQRSRQPGIVLDDQSLWHLIINSAIDQHPRTAALVIYHFAKSETPVPPWLWHIIDTFKIPDSRPRHVPTPGTITLRKENR